MRPFARVGALLVLALGAWSRPAAAGPILDAFYAPPAVYVDAALNDLTRVQTFTVGQAGLLTGFDVLLETPFTFEGGSWAFEIHPTDGSGLPVPGSAPLASAVVSYWHTFDATFFGADVSSAGLFVSPGEIYAIVAVGLPGSGPGGDAGWWAGAYSYPFGAAFTTTASSPAYVPLLDVASDLGFRTYVDPAVTPEVVPEPASLLLLGTGLAGLAALRKRAR